MLQFLITYFNGYTLPVNADNGIKALEEANKLYPYLKIKSINKLE